MTFEELVQLERDKQDDKWGEQNHDDIYWFAILGEEIGELAKAILEMPASNIESETERELVQVAAVCQAMWESGKRNGWL